MNKIIAWFERNKILFLKKDNMKLSKCLKYLKKMNFITNKTPIQIYVTNDGSLNPDNLVFKCRIHVDQAEEVFGQYEVVLNRIKNVSENTIPAFCFVLKYEEKNDLVDKVLALGE